MRDSPFDEERASQDDNTSPRLVDVVGHVSTLYHTRTHQATAPALLHREVGDAVDDATHVTTRGGGDGPRPFHPAHRIAPHRDDVDPNPHPPIYYAHRRRRAAPHRRDCSLVRVPEERCPYQSSYSREHRLHWRIRRLLHPPPAAIRPPPTADGSRRVGIEGRERQRGRVRERRFVEKHAALPEGAHRVLQLRDGKAAYVSVLTMASSGSGPLTRGLAATSAR